MTDQHPHNIPGILTGSVLNGEFLLKEIYEAIRNSPDWNQTLLVVYYDEHGGFYDHFPPPQSGVPNPDGRNNNATGFKFDRLGLRVVSKLKSRAIFEREIQIQIFYRFFDLMLVSNFFVSAIFSFEIQIFYRFFDLTVVSNLKLSEQWKGNLCVRNVEVGAHVLQPHPNKD